MSKVDKILKARSEYIVYFVNGKQVYLSHERFEQILKNARNQHTQYWRKKKCL